MPVSLLDQFDLTKESFYHQDSRDADVRGRNVRGEAFEYCDFTDAIFDDADLTNTTFEACQFAGANPEAAASLEGTWLEIRGLSAEQSAARAARGAIVVDLDDEEEDSFGPYRCGTLVSSKASLLVLVTPPQARLNRWFYDRQSFPWGTRNG